MTRDDLARYPVSIQTMSWAARVFDALGDEAECGRVSRRAVDLARRGRARVAYGRALLRAERRDGALAVLREALALRPRTPRRASCSRQIQPEAPRRRGASRRARATSSRGVREESGYPARVLQNLTVNTVFESGLGSSFRQFAVQVADDEGARDCRTFPIQFDPGHAARRRSGSARVYRGGRRLEAMQTFEQQLGEPWYRIYYDTRALVVVVFPDARARRRGRAALARRRRRRRATVRRLLRRHPLPAGPVPIAHVEYVLITPESRHVLLQRAAQLRGLARRPTQVEGDRAHRSLRRRATSPRSAPSRACRA